MQIMERNAVATPDQQKFYEILFGGAEKYVEIRLIDSKGKPEQFFLTLPELLHYPTPQDVNVYVGIFQRGIKGNGKTENCTTTNVIFLDFDDMGLDEINYRIDNIGLPRTSMTVSSGYGSHVYWLLDKPAGHEVKPIIDKLVEALKADPAARDIARMLRVPDTMNIKGEPVPCRLVEASGRKTSLRAFEDILGVKAHIEPESRTGAVSELLKIRFNGLNNMAGGVKKGERNFTCGRIVQTLKRLNYTKQQASDIVFKWNTLNRPKKSTNELKNEIRVFWHDERYKYDGKEFSEGHLQELNSRFLDDKSTFFKASETDSHNYDNDLLGDNFHKISGLAFAVLSIVKLAEEKGITLKEIAGLCRRDSRDKTLLDSIGFLVQQNHLHKELRRGKATLYMFKEKPFSEKRGYTAVPKLLHKLYIESCNARELERELKKRVDNKAYDRLNETRYKLLILLESYAYDAKREVYPTDRSLADRMRLHGKTIKRNIEWLEQNQFIKTYEKQGQRFIRLIYS